MFSKLKENDPCKFTRREYLKRYSKGSIFGQRMQYRLLTNWHICRPTKLKEIVEPFFCLVTTCDAVFRNNLWLNCGYK